MGPGPRLQHPTFQRIPKLSSISVGFTRAPLCEGGAGVVLVGGGTSDPELGQGSLVQGCWSRAGRVGEIVPAASASGDSARWVGWWAVPRSPGRPSAHAGVSHKAECSHCCVDAGLNDFLVFGLGDAELCEVQLPSLFVQ
eukprot:1415854-Rhodomonas_salina.1